MQSQYGEYLYGYKNDRIVDLIGPIMIQTFIKVNGENEDLSEKKILPFVSQVITFDVLNNRDEAKRGLGYLFKIIDLFDMTDQERHRCSSFYIFILSNNPVKAIIQYELEAKQKRTMSREYLHCHKCHVQDYVSLLDT